MGLFPFPMVWPQSENLLLLMRPQDRYQWYYQRRLSQIRVPNMCESQVSDHVDKNPTPGRLPLHAGSARISRIEYSVLDPVRSFHPKEHVW